jgi:hypothetical protein
MVLDYSPKPGSGSSPPAQNRSTASRRTETLTPKVRKESRRRPPRSHFSTSGLQGIGSLEGVPGRRDSSWPAGDVTAPGSDTMRA